MKNTKNILIILLAIGLVGMSTVNWQMRNRESTIHSATQSELIELRWRLLVTNGLRNGCLEYATNSNGRVFLNWKKR